MISNAELQYVNNYARFAPYPGNDYANKVMEQLINAYKIYTEKYNGKKYNLILSNGEEIQFSILNKNLAHMLGIDYKNIISDPMTQTREDVLGISPLGQTNSYDVLSRIIDRAEDVVKNDSNYNNYKILNYYKIMIKCAIFNKLSEFNAFNFGCINFDKQSYQDSNNENFLPESTKFIWTPSDEALIPYFMMGLKYSNENSAYIPETLFAPTDYQKFFFNQELLLPIQILIDDNQNLFKYVATAEEKLNLLKLYKYIISEYQTNSFINIFNDYETVLKENSIVKTIK